MQNQVTITKPFSLVPTTLAEAIKYAEIMANSDIVPKDFKGKPGNVLVAVQMGAELGLSPLQALQNIAVINGKPSVWGDAALAIVQAHPDYEEHEEFVEGEGEKMVGVFRIKRKGHKWHEVRFSVAQAKKAGLWGKAGPWTQYPDRMLPLRARGFGIRDKFADALRGIITAEEARDYVNVTPKEEAPRQTYQSKAEDLLRKMGATVDPTITDVPAEEEEAEPSQWEVTEETDSRQDKIGVIYEMIDRYKVSEQNVAAWLSKAGASTFSALPEEMLDKFIAGLQQKYENATGETE